MEMKKRWIFLGIGSALAAGLISWGAVASAVEQPDYTVIASSGDIEIREYGSMIAAQAAVSGERQAAMSRGFRIIADYIFGNNRSSSKVAMTAPVTTAPMTSAPVTQQASEKIAMTAPVTAQASGGIWQVRFIMPSEYTMETLPKPVNPEVTLIEVPARRVAAITFSGRGGDNAIAEHENELKQYLQQEGLTAAGPPSYAFYDAPWTPPFMRRNEVLIELD